MPHDILNSMRALREEMAQRLMQVPEYRALVALDRSIDEISAIMCDSLVAGAPVSIPAEARAPQEAPPLAPQEAARKSALATAFAETLAAKIDQRIGARASYPLIHRAQNG